MPRARMGFQIQETLRNESHAISYEAKGQPVLEHAHSLNIRRKTCLVMVRQRRLISCILTSSLCPSEWKGTRNMLGMTE